MKRNTNENYHIFINVSRKFYLWHYNYSYKNGAKNSNLFYVIKLTMA